MMRRRNSRSLSQGRLREVESVDPNASISNIADVMLVVVLGLVVALISQYGIDFTPVEEQESTNSITGIEVEMDADGDGAVDSTYVEAGSVYYDPETGQYYLVEN